MTTETETAIEECKHHWQIASGISPQGHGRRGLRHAVGTGAAAMSEYTPGPWYAVKDLYGGWCIRTVPADATNIDGEAVVFANTGRSSGDPTEADARLIAAAPELLEALEVLLMACTYRAGGEAHQRALAAIHKATGGAS